MVEFNSNIRLPASYHPWYPIVFQWLLNLKLHCPWNPLPPSYQNSPVKKLWFSIGSIYIWVHRGCCSSWHAMKIHFISPLYPHNVGFLMVFPCYTPHENMGQWDRASATSARPSERCCRVNWAIHGWKLPGWSTVFKPWKPVHFMAVKWDIMGLWWFHNWGYNGLFFLVGHKRTGIGIDPIL